MSIIFASVLPVFILILIGWVLEAAGYLGSDTGDALGNFVFKVAIPCLLFLTISQADLDGASPVKLWAAYFGGIGIAWISGQLVAAKVFGRDAKASIVAAFSACFSNLGFIGLPLISTMFGHEGLVAVATILAVHLPTMMTVSIILMENQESSITRKNILRTGKKVITTLARNPIIISIIAGILFRLSPLNLPDTVQLVAGKIAGVAGPAGLIAVGMSLRRYPLAGNLAAAASISAIKLILMPLSVYLLATLFELPPIWTLTAVLGATMPTGVNAWLVANQFDTGQRLAASTVTMTTAFAVITVAIWSLVLGIGQ